MSYELRQTCFSLLLYYLYHTEFMFFFFMSYGVRMTTALNVIRYTYDIFFYHLYQI